MIKSLRKAFGKLSVFRTPKIDQFVQRLYAIYLSIRKKSPILSVFVEISSKCNLACVNCFRTDNAYSAKNINMSFDVFKKTIDEMPYGIPFMVTQMYGESASNPELTRMLQYASDSNKFETIILDSNLLLKEVSFYQSLFDYGLNRLIVSVDSFDQDICNILRTGTDIIKLKDNLTTISKSNPENVHARITVSKVNIGDLENTLSTLAEMKISRVEIGPLFDFKSSGITIDDEDEKHIYSLLKIFNGKMDILFNKNYICTLPFTTISINAVGNVMPCCNVFDDQVINFGNISQGIDNSYYSEDFNNIRSNFYKQMPNYCEGCIYYRKTF